MVTVTAASISNPSATGSTTLTIIGITVSIAPASATVDSEGTVPLTATVNNDPNNGGVTWSLQNTRLVCPRGGFGCHNVTFACTVGCGSFSPVSTSSGAPTTYTAPAKPPVGTVAAIATSVTSTGAKGLASIALRAISVSVLPTSASVGCELHAITYSYGEPRRGERRGRGRRSVDRNAKWGSTARQDAALSCPRIR